MKTEDLKKVTDQLARPSGEMGLDISEKMNDTNSFITRRSIEVLAPKKNEFIVELGPGNGVLSKGVIKDLEPNGRYLGIEISKDMANLAKENLSDNSVTRIDIHCGDCFDVDIKPGSIDGLFGVNVLYFIEDIEELFKRIKPWFKSRGRCVFGIRPVDTLKSLRFHEFGHFVREPQEIKNALKFSGFKDVSVIDFDEGEGRLGDISFPNGSIIIKATVDA